MASFIFIELDTRPPEIEIYAPSYTDSNIVNTITVKSDDDLSDFQNIYLIDSNNDRHDYTFNKKSDKTLIGDIVFKDVSLGFATIYVELEDNVGNRSELFSKNINIIKSTSLLVLNIKDSIMNIDDSHAVRLVTTKDDVILNIKDLKGKTSSISENKTVANIVAKRGVNNE